MKYIFGIIFGIVLSTTTFSQEFGEEFFIKGNEAYHNGDYEQALLNYNQALSNKFMPPELYFNLGNTYYSLGKLGAAIVNFRNAKINLPRDPELKINLDKARYAVQNRVNFPPMPIFLKVLLIPLDYLGFYELLWGLAFLTALIAFLLIFVLFFDLNFIKSKIPLLLFAWIIIAAFSSSLLWKYYHHDVAVICVEETPLFSGPADSYTQIAKLQDGCEVKILDENNIWLKIEFFNNEKREVAWIKKADVLTIY